MKHDSGEAKENLLAGCREYLADHPGIVWVAAGILVEDHQRDVNDRDFDVAHQGKGEALTILELTEEQRQRIR